MRRFTQCDTCWSFFVTTFGMLAVGSMPLIFLIIENRLYNPQYILRKTYQSAFIYKIDIMLYGNSAAHEPAIQ